MADTLGVVLVSADYARVHAAFTMAAGAAALDREVLLFATGAGVRALCADWPGAAEADADARLRARNVAGIAELRAAVLDLGARLIACDSGLRGEAVDPASLLPGVTCAGMASFLEASAGGQLIAF